MSPVDIFTLRTIPVQLKTNINFCLLHNKIKYKYIYIYIPNPTHSHKSILVVVVETHKTIILVFIVFKHSSVVMLSISFISILMLEKFIL